MADEIIKVIEYAIENPLFLTITCVFIVVFVLIFAITVFSFFIIAKNFLSINRRFRSDWRWYR